MPLPFREYLLPFLKYLVAGGMGFVVDYGTLFVLYTLCGVQYLVAAGVAFCVGLIFVYVSSNKWVFDCRKMKDRQWLEFAIFTIIGLIGLALTVAFMWFFVDVVGIHPLIAKLVTTGLVLMWNYSARKIILY